MGRRALAELGGELDRRLESRRVDSGSSGRAGARGDGAAASSAVCDGTCRRSPRWCRGPRRNGMPVELLLRGPPSVRCWSAVAALRRSYWTAAPRIGEDGVVARDAGVRVCGRDAEPGIADVSARDELVHRATAELIGTAKPTPSALPELLLICALMPITRPRASNMGPPEFPRLIGASVWIASTRS